jgi:AcrR family transcriptional regulator
VDVEVRRDDLGREAEVAVLDAARAQIAVSGPAGLSMRSVARSLGMTVQALYHYFPSRDEVVTALITEAYHELGDAVEAAIAGAGDQPRFVAAAAGYRGWAIEKPALFQLLYGTPLVGYAAPADGATTAAASRLGGIFIRELFGPYTEAQLAVIDVPPLGPAMREVFPGVFGSLPPPAVALFLNAWGRLHGLVVLEAFGHTAFIGDAQAEVFEWAIRGVLADTRARIDVAA